MRIGKLDFTKVIESQFMVASDTINDLKFAIITFRHKLQKIEHDKINGLCSNDDAFKLIFEASQTLYQSIEDASHG